MITCTVKPEKKMKFFKLKPQPWTFLTYTLSMNNSAKCWHRMTSGTKHQYRNIWTPIWCSDNMERTSTKVSPSAEAYRNCPSTNSQAVVTQFWQSWARGTNKTELDSGATTIQDTLRQREISTSSSTVARGRFSTFTPARPLFTLHFFCPTPSEKATPEQSTLQHGSVKVLRRFVVSSWT